MLKKLFLGYLVAGLLLLFGSHILGTFLSISDFFRGFFDGVSAVLIVAGLIYLVCSLLKKKLKS